MKVELKIEAPGVQVYAYEINEEAKNLLQENANNDFPISGMEIVEEHATVTLISNGIAARDNGCKYTVSINGDEKPFYPALFEWFETEDCENPDSSTAPIATSAWSAKAAGAIEAIPAAIANSTKIELIALVFINPSSVRDP